MIKYYDKLILSFREIDNHPCLLIHALTGCPFHCYHCFNYDELIAKIPDEYYSIDDVIDYIIKQNNLFDYIILSGGEYLNAPLNDLISDLKQIKQVCSKPIIIYTTGIELDKIHSLVDLNLVDGFHVDMKLPYHLLTKENYELIELTMGIKVKNLSIFQTILTAIDYIVKVDRGYSRFRSIRYPFLNPSAFEECRIYINHLNSKYNKNVPYDVNPFIYPEIKD
jgi:pyruvate-formate lyase-activating enzyme